MPEITADTITDAQIRGLRMSLLGAHQGVRDCTPEIQELIQTCTRALCPIVEFWWGFTREEWEIRSNSNAVTMEARARCAEILNARKAG